MKNILLNWDTNLVFPFIKSTANFHLLRTVLSFLRPSQNRQEDGFGPWAKFADPGLDQHYNKKIM